MVDRSKLVASLCVGVALLGAAPVWAGNLYINGVRADGLSETEFKNVNVRVDSKGDVYVDAPRYTVEVLQPGGVPAAPVATPVATPAAVPAPVTAPPVAAQPTYAAPTSAPPTAGAAVAPGTWWLVTDDNASKGHVIDVYIGGVLVQTVRSGDPQVMLDVSAYLRPGENAVQFTARPGETPSGGVLHVYLGSGVIAQGTLNLNAPQIDFSRRSSDGGAGATRQYQLRVN